MASYEITISQDVFSKTLEFAVPAKNRLSMDLRGSWYHDFVKMICTTEFHAYDIRPTAGRLNHNSKRYVLLLLYFHYYFIILLIIDRYSKRINTPYFTSNFACKSGCPCKYQIVLDKLTDEAFLKLQVKRTGEHDHTSIKSTKPTKHVRGAERAEIANIVKSEFNGSSKAFCDTMKGRGISNVPDKDIVREIVSEQFNESVVSTSWITNILSAACKFYFIYIN